MCPPCVLIAAAIQVVLCACAATLADRVWPAPQGTMKAPETSAIPVALAHAGDSESSEAQPARIVNAHTTRPAVSRGLIHQLCRLVGIQLEGKLATNEISTAKYTLLTFLPVNLFEQFMRIANLYFLLCAILQLIPGLSPTSWFTTVAPLVFVLAVNAIKEGYDDVNRHKNDNQINNRQVLMLTEQGEAPVFWKDVVAGDLIKVRCTWQHVRAFACTGC